ncbi:ATP-binding protein [Streptomyces cinereoruber]|uniref:ATP-binding protein n=1 Tax=Streptomyces cinereoruber TaxID=67260 RepID=UPI003BF5EF70
MLEVVALSALTTFLLGVGNGAAGEVGKNLSLSVCALARKTLGREVPLPADVDGREELARQLYARVIHDPRLAGEWTLLMESGRERATELSRGGMPPAPWAFTNQQKVLKQLMGEATRPWEGRPRIALLYGPPGGGTTSVARRLGAECRDLFPDGQFCIDLRESAGASEPEPAAILLRLLREMGVGADEIPSTEADREQLYRRLTAERRVLVVIDHVTSLDQVRGLVPATPDVFLLVVVSGQPLLLEAERVAVPPLSKRHAKQMVLKTVGQENIRRFKLELRGLLDRCQGNPLALHVEARLLAGGTGVPDRGTEPWWHHPVRATAQRASLRLGPETVRLCRLTALGGWPSISAEIAAAAAGVDDEARAARMLSEAADAGLLELLPDARYRFRPEIRRHLADTAAPEHGVQECSDAVTRVLDALLNRVLRAAHAALSASWRTEPDPEPSGAFRDESEGIAVLAAEVTNVVHAVFVAEERRQVVTALRLARALWPLQLKAGHWDEVLPALRVAVRCGEQNRTDERMTGALYFQLAHCLGELHRWEQANRATRTAVAYERAAGHLLGEASAVEWQGLLCLNRWQAEEAYGRFVEAESVYRRIAPGQEGAEDLPRALALVGRHQGRALRVLGRLDESRRLLEGAVAFFEGSEEAYNRARALTDLAETLHDIGDDATALAKITDAELLLTPAAAPHLRYLANLRRRCEATAR